MRKDLAYAGGEPARWWVGASVRSNASITGPSAPSPAAMGHALSASGGPAQAHGGALTIAESHAALDHEMDARGGVIVHAPERFRPRRQEPVGGWMKRAFDITVSAGALTVLAPLLLAIAAAVRIESPGAAIFRQDRGGYDGRTFKIWKFRTMSVAENGAQVRQAERVDDRVTKLGAFLRRTSLDEFPQLVNVLIGDMSLVGPRPHALCHDRDFEAIDKRYPMRARARPGMTGRAQVNGCRGPTPTQESVRARTGHDVAYVEEWCFLGDLRIIGATIALLWHDPEAF
jgi:undecaprenyl-phosphate glucose phosphotransferase